MDAFAKARAKYEKNRERQSRPVPVVEPVEPEKKEEPKAVKKDGPMVVRISGPSDLVFEIDYAGTLLCGQLTPQALTELFKKHLSAFGRVRCL
jgi:hypothetical protein